MEAGVLRGGGDRASVSEGPESRLATFRFFRRALLMKQHSCPSAGDRDSHAPESPAAGPGVPRARAPSRLIEALSVPGLELSRGKSYPVPFSSVAQSCPTLCDPWTAARQASLSITNSQSLPKLMSIESMMPSNHLILCRHLLLQPLIFPSIRVFSNESALRIRWPKYWSFSFSISLLPMNIEDGFPLGFPVAQLVNSTHSQKKPPPVPRPPRREGCERSVGCLPPPGSEAAAPSPVSASQSVRPRRPRSSPEGRAGPQASVTAPPAPAPNPAAALTAVDVRIFHQSGDLDAGAGAKTRGPRRRQKGEKPGIPPFQHREGETPGRRPPPVPTTCPPLAPLSRRPGSLPAVPSPASSPLPLATLPGFPLSPAPTPLPPGRPESAPWPGPPASHDLRSSPPGVSPVCTPPSPGSPCPLPAPPPFLNLAPSARVGERPRRSG